MIPAYVVMGRTGEYSDRTEWPVRAFLCRERAENLVALASARARELFMDYERTRRRPVCGSNEYDAAMDMDYTGTTYAVMEVVLDVDEELSHLRCERGGRR